MNIWKKSLLLLLAMTLTFMVSVPVFAANASSDTVTEDKRVLFLSSYAYSWSSVPSQIKGIQNMMKEKAIINYEFMDTKNTVYRGNYTEFYDLLKYKLSNRDPYDAIVVGDDAALNFALDYQTELFPETPIIFEGVDNIETAERAAVNPWFTGIVEKVDYQRNIELAKTILPKATKLIFILDGSENGIGIKQQLQKCENEFQGYDVEYINSSQYSKSELRKKLRSLDDQCIVFALSMSQRQDGTIYTEDERYQLIEKNVQVPIFRVSSSALGECENLLGGCMVDHEKCGELTGKILKEVLAGKKISDIPINLDTPHCDKFNKKTIEKFQLSLSNFPNDAIYINDDKSFMEIHYRSIIMASFAMIIVLLVFLLIHSWYARKKQETLNYRLDLGNEELNRRNIELEMKNQELAKANEYKSDFLSRVSHDIRTPMNTIMNLTNMVEEEIDDSQTALKDLQKMKTSNEFLLSLVNDILDMSRIDQKRMELHAERYSYDEFLNYIQSTFEPLSVKKNIEFTIISGDENVDIMIDKVRFNQLCFNLLANAIKYTPEGGHVEFRMVHGTIQNNLLPCEIYVKDDGIGMTKEFQEKMYDAFAQEGRAFSTVEGTGLGLAIVKEIATLLGATIDVDSKENMGTTFHIHMNMVLAEPEDLVQTTKKPSLEKGVLKGRKLLVAEDHPMNQEIIRRILEKHGIVVTLVSNGQEALDAFSENPELFDGILMDVRMPVMDGITATRKLRSLPIEKAVCIPIIAMTANAMEEDKKRTLQAGMNAHLSKPINQVELYQKLCEYLSETK